MSINKKLLGEAELIKKPQKKLNLTIKDGAITKDKIAPRAVTSDKLGDDILTQMILPLINSVRDNLQAQIDALEVSGIALENDLGSGTTIGITQKGITDAINTLWTKIGQLTGETNYAFDFSVTPTVFDGYSTTSVRVQAAARNSSVFSNIMIAISPEGQPQQMINEYNVSTVDHTFNNIGASATVVCIATINGVMYAKSQKIKQKNYFWIGAAPYSDYAEQGAMETLVQINDKMGGNYDVEFQENDYLYVIQKKGCVEFERADMNGIEIEMDCFDDNPTIAVDNAGMECTVFRSLNTFKAGTYNININA